MARTSVSPSSGEHRCSPRDFIGADGGTRTRTIFRSADFKSAASAISPHRPAGQSPQTEWGCAIRNPEVRDGFAAGSRGYISLARGLNWVSLEEWKSRNAYNAPTVGSRWTWCSTPRSRNSGSPPTVKCAAVRLRSWPSANLGRFSACRCRGSERAETAPPRGQGQARFRPEMKLKRIMTTATTRTIGMMPPNWRSRAPG